MRRSNLRRERQIITVEELEFAAKLAVYMDRQAKWLPKTCAVVALLPWRRWTMGCCGKAWLRIGNGIGASQVALSLCRNVTVLTR
jgi:hypothetical protein